MFKIHYLLFCVLAGCFGLSVKAQNWSTGIVSGGSNTQYSTDIVDLEDGGSVVVGNYYRGTATFGSYSLPWSTFSSDPNNTNVNSYIVKYAANNTVSWATRISSPYTANIVSVAADDAGYVYVCGQYSETTSFYSVGSVTPLVLFSTGSTSSNGFIAKYTPGGVLMWAKRGISTSGTESLQEIAVSDDGAKLVASGKINTALPITVGSSSVSTGSFLLWVNSGSGIFERAYNYSNDASYATPYQYGLCMDANKNIYVAGSFTGTSYSVKGSGSPILVSSPNNSASSRAVVIAKYNPTGALLWAKASRATAVGSFTQPSALVCDGSNNIYLGGSVNSALSNYNLQFYDSVGFTNIPINIGFNSSFFVVKLNGSNGNAKWKTYGRQSSTGTRAISLAVGSCNNVFAGINTAHANPSFTDVNLTNVATSLSGNAFMVFKLNSNGVLQNTQPHVLSRRYNYAYLGCRYTLNVHCASGLNQSISLQTSGSPINLTPNGIDVLYALFNDNGSLPTLNLNPQSIAYCAYDNITLSGTVTGPGPYTISWNIYDSTSGTYVNLGTTGTPSFNLNPAQYNPYIFNFFGYTVIYMQVIVTNCSGQSATAYQFIAFSGGVTFSQILGVDVCYTPGVTTSDAVFSVNAVNATSYLWQYSPDGGTNWYGIPGTGYIENLNQLTVLSPSPGQHNYLFRCIMFGPCNTVVSNPALLTVLPCPGFRSQEMLAMSHEDGTQFALYPNPVNHALTVEYYFEQPHTDTRMMITDLTGRILSEADLEQQGTLQQDVSALANGSYICVLAQGKDILKKEKFIVQH